MASYRIELTKSVTTEELRKKFRAFVTLYGSTKIFLRGNVYTRDDRSNIIPAFFNIIPVRVTRMAGKFLTVDVAEELGHTLVYLPKYDPIPNLRSGYEPIPEISFISDKP